MVMFILYYLYSNIMYDEYGCVHYCVDETLRRRLETKLIKTIIGFKIVR